MVWLGDSREGSCLVPPAAGGEQGPTGQDRDQKWVWLPPGRRTRGRSIVEFRGSFIKVITPLNQFCVDAPVVVITAQNLLYKLLT